MDKLAQRKGLLNKLRESESKGDRSILNRLKEKTNFSGMAAEKFFNPEFKKVMESLRAKDDDIRSLVIGVQIGEGDPGEDPIALKELLKSAKSNLNRREYMLAVADLGRFHQKVAEIKNKIDSLNFDISKVHQEFLFGKQDDPILQDKHKKHFQYLNKNFGKTASIADLWHNLMNDRGKALRAWEKRYPAKAKVLSKRTGDMISASEVLLSRIITSLKEMGSARAERNIDQYVNSAKIIINNYTKYNSLFSDYYRNIIQPELKNIDLSTTKEEVISNNTSIPTTNTLPVVNTPPSSPVAQKAPVVSTTPIINNPDNAPDTQRTPPPIMTEVESEEQAKKRDTNLIYTTAHDNFISSLESMSKESPLILASYINKYAKIIKSQYPETAINLFNIVATIKK